MVLLSVPKVPKVPNTLQCKICNYTTYRNSQLERHFLSLKHLNATKKIQNTTKDEPNIKIYQCLYCVKTYKHHSSLWKHNKNCNKNPTCKPVVVSPIEAVPIEVKTEITDKELILMLLQQNAELIKNVNSNITNTNSHNKTFNLQFFLNEECKNALNISEFVSSIQVELEDLETTGRLGYVEGVTRIINKNLNVLDKNKRPIHCSDIKREVLYIKNEDQWIKEDDTKPILKKAIREIANENIKQIGEWRKKYPDCTESDSRKNDTYLNIVSNAMSGCTSDEQIKNYDKIITNVAKGVSIEK